MCDGPGMDPLCNIVGQMRWRNGYIHTDLAQCNNGLPPFCAYCCPTLGAEGTLLKLLSLAS